MSKESESKISNLNLDSNEDFERKSQIATDALSYVLSKMATSSTEYILIFCKEHSLTPQIMDSSIIELLRSHKIKLNRSIYRPNLWNFIFKILEFEPIINFENCDVHQNDETIAEAKQKSVPPSSQKNRDKNKVLPAQRSLEESKTEQRAEEFEEQTSSNSQIYGAFEYNEVLPKRFTSAGEKFNKDHVIEIMFRSKMFSEELEIDIIKELYEGL